MEDYNYSVDEFKEFARSKSEFLRIIKKSKPILGWLKYHSYDISKIDGSMVEVDKGREGNWNSYVAEFGGEYDEEKGINLPRKINPKDNWYEYHLVVRRIPKK
jgi:hypothetical protein